MSYPIDTQSKRFWAKVKRCRHGTACKGCCWVWQGARNTAGYGRTKYVINGQSITYAHRVAYVLHNSLPLMRLSVCHHCDNPSCCNPNHLWLGTHQDNHRDASRKGRKKGRPGKPVKLSVHKVRLIRTAYANGETTRVLCARFGVSQPMVSNIVSRKTWRHVG